MTMAKNLKDVISLNKDFKSAINLYLNLNKKEKILSYIPTSSSLRFLCEYIENVITSKEQATLLVGPYGKGKSHLLLVLLAVLSMERNETNKVIIDQLVEKISEDDEIGRRAKKNILEVWCNHKKMLPILISGNHDDLNQAFLFAMNDALKRENLSELVPDTYYSIAIERINNWIEEYPETYKMFEKCLLKCGKNVKELIADLKGFSKESLNIFMQIYPKVTAGSQFNPMASSDVLPLFKGISEQLVDKYDYDGIYIVFDEFSKFIESQDGRATGNNMKLLQDICELATDSKNNKVFITMVAHKSIKEYGKYLSQEIINSFTGIEGRLVEKFFVTSSKNNYELIKNAINKVDGFDKVIPRGEHYFSEKNAWKYYEMPFFKADMSKDDFDSLIFRGCYPLLPVSAYLLLNISEKVAQNERTLFTFISNEETHSLAKYVSDHEENMDWQIDSELIYDYFSGLFKKEIVNEHVHNEWLNAEYALSKCKTLEQKKVIKALALILIANKNEELPALEEFVNMAAMSEGSDGVVTELINTGLIYKKGSNNCLAFKTRAGSELRTEIKKQRVLRGEVVNFSKVFKMVTGKYYVIPRRYNTDNWMTRYFSHEYMSVEEFLNINDGEALLGTNNADGLVITLYSLGATKQEAVKKHLQNLANERVIVVSPKQKFVNIKTALDLDIVEDLKSDTSFSENNEVLKRELPLMEEDLNDSIFMELDDIYTDEACKVYWCLSGDIITSSSKEEENVVNKACSTIYYKTPIINNEMINRKALTTGQTKKSRNNIVKALLNHEDGEEFYKGTNQDATIYRSLFINTKIKEENSDPVIAEIIDIMNNFVDDCSDNRQSLSLLVNKLIDAPYGMRNAVIPIYLSYVLSKRREDIVIYFSDLEVQLDADIVINMCENASDYEIFVSKEDIEKEKYISSLNHLFDVEDNINLSDSRIKNIFVCMQRWFRALPQVTRNVSILSEFVKDEEKEKAALQIKKILQKVEVNPYEILFVTLPNKIGNGSFVETYEMIDICKTLFDDYYDWMLNRTVDATMKLFSARKKTDLHHVLKEWFDKQSNLSKQGLYSGRVTNFMYCIDNLNVYDNQEVVKKIVKASTDVYLENWNDNSYDDYLIILEELKKEIESIKEEKSDGKMKLSFIGTYGKEIERYYEPVSEGTGTVLRNIIEDTLEEYDDLSINDRVAILLEMIEKVIR